MWCVCVYSLLVLGGVYSVPLCVCVCVVVY